MIWRKFYFLVLCWKHSAFFFFSWRAKVCQLFQTEECGVSRGQDQSGVS